VVTGQGKTVCIPELCDSCFVTMFQLRSVIVVHSKKTKKCKFGYALIFITCTELNDDGNESV